jgi:hypothetical protein
MANPNLSESTWQRATTDAGRIYPTTAFEVAATLMTIIFGAIAAVASSGENTTTQIAAPVIGGALALLVTFGVVFVVQLAAAPVRQRNELRAGWQVPEIETVNVDLTLRNAHRKGNELAQSLEAKGGSSTRHDRQAADMWVEEVVGLLAGNVPDADSQQFIAAGRNEQGPVRRLRIRVDALQQIIDRVAGAVG